MLHEMSFVQYKEWLDFFERRNQAMEEAQRGLPGHEGPPIPKPPDGETGVREQCASIIGSLKAYNRRRQKSEAGIPPGFRRLGEPG